MLSDGQVTLRPIQPADLDAMYDWTVDAATHSISDPRPLLPLTRASYNARRAENESAPDRAEFSIEVEGRCAGNCQMVFFDHLARRAMVGITIAPGERGRHVGRRALALLVDYGFRHRNLHRVWLGTQARNEAGLRAYAAVGFVEESRQRDAVWTEGHYVDEVTMGVLRAEWLARHPEPVAVAPAFASAAGSTC
jgi:RimJ/RimL family protein N-acetyltransferase